MGDVGGSKMEEEKIEFRPQYEDDFGEDPPEQETNK